MPQQGVDGGGAPAPGTRRPSLRRLSMRRRSSAGTPTEKATYSFLGNQTLTPRAVARLSLAHVEAGALVGGPGAGRGARGGWDNQLDFLFSCISVSVGLGNVWRFPYLCYKNGGGTFLLTYFVAMVFCGIPMFFQEVALGQYLGAGGMTLVGTLCPILRGTGYATMAIVFLLDVYYCVIVAWTLFYLIATFTVLPGLPWESCGNWWNSEQCSRGVGGANRSLDLSGPSSAALTDGSGDGDLLTALGNQTLRRSTPVEEFWDRRVLQLSAGLDELGGMQWELLGCLLLGWLLVYLIICRGLHQSGKIVWFTALFPYAIMLVLAGRAVTLPGAVDGLVFLLVPDWSSLLSAGPWIDGATQIFFSYSIGVGTLPALGSYNAFHHNCHKDAIITCVVNSLTCLLAGGITFSILGYIAHVQGKDVSSVVSSGPGLVFITYPEVVQLLPGAPAWAFIFFFMLLILGVDSEFCNVESFVTGMVDKWPEQLQPRRKLFTLAVCSLMFLLAIPMVTQGGMYIFQLMDMYAASGISLLWVALFQTVAVSWVFGVDRFALCVREMTGVRPGPFWRLCWLVLAPAVMLVIFLWSVVQYLPMRYGDYDYPGWGEAVGLLISCASMLWIPGYAVYYMLATKGTFAERLAQGLTAEVKPNLERRPTLVLERSPLASPTHQQGSPSEAPDCKAVLL
ncbi:sodium- and chloride-dependent GABA transporter 1-like [Frankliniella occidentalis]|uniref:Transporter n=1 Tax=Frankliniella occidentalis TaxID=133901 RepID=A0A6J1SUD5_FRAOC|nr:sodium- and chloride-dependent GABA transporter 1-like [Frankliniella occidentalis]